MKIFQQKIIKPWGYELIFTPPDSPVTGKIEHVKAGARCSYQYHDKKRETLCLIKGKAKIIIEGKEVEMKLKKGYYLKPLVKHRFIGITDCDIVESSTKEEGNTIRLEDDYSRPTETEIIRKQPNRGWTAHEE